MSTVLYAQDLAAFKKGPYFFQLTSKRPLSGANHSHEFYELIYMISGSCIQEINHQILLMQQGMFTFLKPGDIHSFNSQSADASLLALSILPEETEHFLICYGKELTASILDAARIFTLTPYEQQELMNEIERTITASDNSRITHYRIIFGRMIHSILHDSSPVISAPESFTAALLSMHSFENIREGVPALVRLSGFSARQLSRLMAKHMGVTGHDYVLDLRMNAARQLITSSSMDFETIAETVGFKSFSHFCMVYKKTFKKTPAGMRKSAGAKTV
ncbi:MAG: helix-turn-helix domain-containing protein [Bacillota bacterium]|nr:helix-turn-helix domain-containing protein [Bacillota bacterium]